MTQPTQNVAMQTAVGAGVLLVGLALAAGAVSIPSAAGYGGVGPSFLPWAMAAALCVCGVLIIREARTGGFRVMDAPSGAEHTDPDPFRHGREHRPQFRPRIRSLTAPIRGQTGRTGSDGGGEAVGVERSDRGERAGPAEHPSRDPMDVVQRDRGDA